MSGPTDTPDPATLQLAREMCATPQAMVTFLETRVRLHQGTTPIGVYVAAIAVLTLEPAAGDVLQEVFDELHAAVDDREPDAVVLRERVLAALSGASDVFLGEWFVAREAEIGPSSLAGACYGLIGRWFLEPAPGSPRRRLQDLAAAVEEILDETVDAATIRNRIRAHLQLEPMP